MADLRYYLDVDLTDLIAAQLRRRGVDAISAHEVARTGQALSDSDQLAFATMEGRVLVSRDRHFIRLATELTPHAGVILLQRPLSLGAMIGYLDLTSRLKTEEEMKDRLHYCDW